MSFRRLFSDGYYQLVLLAPAIQKRRREGIEAAFSCQTCRRIQPEGVAVKAAVGLAECNFPEEGLRIIVGPDDKGQILALRVRFECGQPFLEFQVGLDMRVVKKSMHDEIFAAQDRNRVNGAGATANMEKNSIQTSHLLTTSQDSSSQKDSPAQHLKAFAILRPVFA
jgi:hypothetical protein